jgi:hypothetical protein
MRGAYPCQWFGRVAQCSGRRTSDSQFLK